MSECLWEISSQRLSCATHIRHTVAMTYFVCSESLAALVAEQLACEITSL